MLEGFKAVTDAGMPPEGALEGARVFGDTLRRLAETLVRLVHVHIHERLMEKGVPEEEVTRRIHPLQEAALPILDRIVNEKKIDGRGFVVKRLKWGKDLKDCNILFISSSEKAHFQEVIQIVKGMPVLTIGETPNFARRGGIINFTLEDSKVRFEVNIEAARQADLNISSRLLSLARIVQEDVAYGRKTQ